MEAVPLDTNPGGRESATSAPPTGVLSKNMFDLAQPYGGRRRRLVMLGRAHCYVILPCGVSLPFFQFSASSVASRGGKRPSRWRFRIFGSADERLPAARTCAQVGGVQLRRTGAVTVERESGSSPQPVLDSVRAYPRCVAFQDSSSLTQPGRFGAFLLPPRAGSCSAMTSALLDDRQKACPEGLWRPRAWRETPRVARRHGLRAASSPRSPRTWLEGPGIDTAEPDPSTLSRGRWRRSMVVGVQVAAHGVMAFGATNGNLRATALGATALDV